MTIKANIKALFIVGIVSLSFCFTLLPLYSQESGILEVEAEGEAAIVGDNSNLARDQALEAAKRNAVEQGIGVLIASETLTENFAQDQTDYSG